MNRTYGDGCNDLLVGALLRIWIPVNHTDNRIDSVNLTWKHFTTMTLGNEFTVQS